MKSILRNNFIMIKYIFKYIPSHIFITILVSILSSAGGIISILYVRYILICIENNYSLNHILIPIAIIFIFNILNQMLNAYLNQIIIPRNTHKLNQNMQIDIFEKTISLDLECYDDSNFYDKFSMALEQSDSRAMAVLQTFSSFISNLFSIGALITLISQFDFFVIVIIFLNVTFNTILNKKKMTIQHNFYEESIKPSRQLGYVQRVFFLSNYAKEVRLFKKCSLILKENFKKNIFNLINIIKKYGKKFMRINFFQVVISNINDNIIMIVLVYRCLSGLLKVADFVALSSATSQLSGRLLELTQIYPNLYQHSIYISDFMMFMNYESKVETNYGNITNFGDNSIYFNNVSFKYPNTKEYVIKDLTITFKKGEKIAIVGRNGSGKSTIVKLLTRLYDPNQGSVRIGENNLADYNINTLREKIGIVFQDYQIFSFSVAENILMRPIEDENDILKVKEALKYVGLYDKISKLPYGINTILTREFSNDGLILSGGELQKIVIARIYVKKSSIIILDEPSSSLDPISESELFNSIMKVSKDSTIIMISHRLSNVTKADIIFYLENGNVVEQGKHDKLMNLGGKYFKMYLAQVNREW